MDPRTPINRRSAILGTLGAAISAGASQSQTTPAQTAPAGGKRRNILFILTDDHRYDAMSFMKAQKFPVTPNIDAMAREAAHSTNPFVTTPPSNGPPPPPPHP